MTLAELNALDRTGFVAALGGIFEHSPWVAEHAYAARPFASVEALHRAMVAAMHEASRDEQLALIRAHPELAGRAMVRRELTTDSASEQSGAGLDRCSPEEFARLTDLKTARPSSPSSRAGSNGRRPTSSRRRSPRSPASRPCASRRSCRGARRRAVRSAATIVRK